MEIRIAIEQISREFPFFFTTRIESDERCRFSDKLLRTSILKYERGRIQTTGRAQDCRFSWSSELILINKGYILPMHVFPSPAYPSLHVQV